VSHIENFSFITGHGMELITAGDSDSRNRDRIHFRPPESPLVHGNYKEILKAVTYSDEPKRIFIRVEDNYRVLDPVELNIIRDLPINQRRQIFNAIAAEMYWAEEVIIENAVPVVMPYSLLEPKI
jgi:hypothetical protein